MKPFGELLREQIAALQTPDIDKHLSKNTAIQFKNKKFKLRGNATFKRIQISIENKKGDIRTGIDPNGQVKCI